VSARDPLAPAEVRDHVDTLAAILFDCVDGGASVSYMDPFTLVGPGFLATLAEGGRHLEDTASAKRRSHRSGSGSTCQLVPTLRSCRRGQRLGDLPTGSFFMAAG
jgi:hypothetical protein